MTEDNAVDCEVAELRCESKPERKPIPLRMKALLGMLLLMGVTFGVNAAHVRVLENELQAIAQTKESEWTRVGDSGETVSVVTATKEYLIYGKVLGKVEVFVKTGGVGDRLFGIEYFFSRHEGEWTETDSGTCSAEDCQIRGAQAFERK